MAAKPIRRLHRRATLAQTAVLTCLTCVTWAVGCSSPTTPPSTMPADTSCPAAPDVCPASMPSYTTDVAPIMHSDCVPCHSSNTGGKDESTYESAAGQKSAILFQVGDCLMPPSGSPQLSTTARNTLLGWIECGAPDN